MKCPLTDIEIRKCPVTTCMWHTNVVKDCCVHGTEQLPKLKVGDQTKATNTLKNALILHTYLEWGIAKGIHLVADSIDVETVNRLKREVAPYNIKEYHWTPNKIALSVSDPYFRLFCKERGIVVKRNDLLNFTYKQTIFLKTHFIKEYKHGKT